MQQHLPKVFNLSAVAASLSAAASLWQPILGCIASVVSVGWVIYQWNKSQK